MYDFRWAQEGIQRLWLITLGYIKLQISATIYRARVVDSDIDKDAIYTIVLHCSAGCLLISLLNQCDGITSCYWSQTHNALYNHRGCYNSKSE